MSSAATSPSAALRRARILRGQVGGRGLNLLAAGLWAAAVASTPVERMDPLLFFGAPAYALVGYPARTQAYLHAPARLRALVWPVEAVEHEALSRARHLLGFLSAAGIALVFLSLSLSLLGRSLLPLLGPLGFFVSLYGLERLAIGLGSAWGRPTENPSTEAIRASLGGGWTSGEATVHLYTPAMALGGASAVGMLIPLLQDAAVQGLSLLGLGVLSAALSRVAAPLYRDGLFRACPRVHEAERTLSGPPVPIPAPRFMALLAPAVRVRTLSMWRRSPVPGLRLWACLGVSAWWMTAAVDQGAPSWLGGVVSLCVALAYFVPFARMGRDRSELREALRPFPVMVGGQMSPAVLWLPTLLPLVAFGWHLQRSGAFALWLY